MAYNTQNTKSDRQRLGGLWTKIAKNTGKKYLTGALEVNNRQIRVVVFKNDKKKTETSPDYSVYLAEDKKDNGGGGGRQIQRRQQDDDGDLI